MKYLVVCFLSVIVLLAPAYAESTIRLDIAGIKRIQAEEITIDLSIRDAQTGQDLLLESANVVVLQNGQPSDFNLTLLQTTPTSPSVNFGSGQLQPQGAVIGLVVDLSTAMNMPHDPVNYVQLQRELAEAWLEQGRDTPSEQIALFIPPSYERQEPFQLPGLEGFQNDRNKLIQALRIMPPRRGATQLHATIREALAATSAQAKVQGVRGYVVVLSDGGDQAFDQTPITWANDIPVLIFATGAEAVVHRYTAPLDLLAQQTQGVYIAHPTEEQVAKIYHSTIQQTPRLGYRLSLKPSQSGNQPTQTVQIQVFWQGQAATSTLLTIPTSPAHPQQGFSLTSVLLWYALQVSLLLIALAAAGTLCSLRLFPALGSSWNHRTRL